MEDTFGNFLKELEGIRDSLGEEALRNARATKNRPPSEKEITDISDRISGLSNNESVELRHDQDRFTEALNGTPIMDLIGVIHGMQSQFADYPGSQPPREDIQLFTHRWNIIDTAKNGSVFEKIAATACEIASVEAYVKNLQTEVQENEEHMARRAWDDPNDRRQTDAIKQWLEHLQYHEQLTTGRMGDRDEVILILPKGEQASDTAYFTRLQQVLADKFSITSEIQGDALHIDTSQPDFEAKFNRFEFTVAAQRVADSVAQLASLPYVADAPEQVSSPEQTANELHAASQAVGEIQGKLRLVAEHAGCGRIFDALQGGRGRE